MSNVNINKTTQVLFDNINNAFKLSCHIRSKTLSPKNTTKPWISGEICANIKKRQYDYALVKQNKICPFNSMHDLKILSQIKLGMQKYTIFPVSLNNLKEIVKTIGNK